MRQRSLGLRVQLPQQALAGVFQHVQHLLETGRAAVVGVGHFLRLVALAKRGEAVDFWLVLRRAQGAGDAFVVGIHHQYPVKGCEVAGLQVPRPLCGQVVAACCGVLLTAWIRRRADVVAVRAG